MGLIAHENIVHLVRGIQPRPLVGWDLVPNLGDVAAVLKIGHAGLQAATYPFEVVRRQLQLQSQATKMSTLSTCIKIVERGGVPVLYAGLVPSLLQVKWSSVRDKSLPEPPTAVFLHGILGSRKNWGNFTRRLAQEFPTWQFLLVDLRCHGDSASIKKTGPNIVSSTALDVLKLVRQLRITPRVLVGHSFGGKVALSMVEQVAKPLVRPVRVWVLDSTPGKVHPGGDGEDHPAELISVNIQLLPFLSLEFDCFYYL
uniref:abhydrolase domain-containing protein IMO32-like n=1 Tax=Fragaria vesca subsp. vesca TaxID=101020 RepID=UPI0005CA0020|nr:PREDICTED: abhydrolase domain-containing protein IMO32-like [Fragaria vesca subsp. vesca]